VFVFASEPRFRRYPFGSLLFHSQLDRLQVVSDRLRHRGAVSNDHSVHLPETQNADVICCRRLDVH
jgi:hypothetical protein